MWHIENKTSFALGGGGGGGWFGTRPPPRAPPPPRALRPRARAHVSVGCDRTMGEGIVHAIHPKTTPRTHTVARCAHHHTVLTANVTDTLTTPYTPCIHTHPTSPHTHALHCNTRTHTHSHPPNTLRTHHTHAQLLSQHARGTGHTHTHTHTHNTHAHSRSFWRIITQRTSIRTHIKREVRRDGACPRL
jgi:hypothetical protein